MRFRRHDIWQQSFDHTIATVRSGPLRNSCTASDERCESLATGLRLGPLSSTIQLSPPPGWPRRNTGKATMVGACTGMFKHLLPTTAHHNKFFEAWATSAHERLPGTILKLWLRDTQWGAVNGSELLTAKRLHSTELTRLVHAVEYQYRWIRRDLLTNVPYDG